MSIQALVLAIQMKLAHAQRDLSCLAETIYHEARGESQAGKIAVANVVLNRVEHSRWPNAICRVVYQRGQFSWTRSKPRITDKQAWRASIQVAAKVYKQHLAHRRLDNTHGSHFFLASKHHHRGTEPTICIGRHSFSRLARK